MNINCPKCGKEYEIDDSKIPLGGAKVKCSECETMIDIDYPIEDKPDWYITTDHENIYEASDEEVTEWILENRLLREHKISKNSENWTRLDEVPKFLTIFKEKEKKEAPVKETVSQVVKEDKLSVQTYKKIDYTDYDDSIIEDSSNYKKKKRHIFMWITILVVLGAGVFALVKPKLVKEIFTKINSKNNVKSEDDYNRAMTLLKNYDVQDKKNILLLFDKSLKGNPNYEPSLIGKSIFISNSLYFEKLDLVFRENLSKKLDIISKQNNNKIINKILVKNNNSIIKIKENIKSLENLLSASLKSKLKVIASKNNYDSSVVLGLISYLENNKNSLKKYLGDSTTIKMDDSNTAFLKLLNLKINNDGTYLDMLDELTTKYANSIPLNFLNAFELLNQDKYVNARYIFKGIKGLSPKNKIATEYILLLNDLIKNKELLVEKKEVEENVKNENSKEDLKKNDVVKEDSKKIVEKVVTPNIKEHKVVKKLSASRATQIGWELIDSNKLSAAITKFKYAISVDPNYAVAYQGLGEVYRIKKENKNAVKYFKIFLSKAPNNSEAGLVRKQIKKLESDK
jgi:predicted Zn finger-like uncharacterized protein